MSNRKIIKIDEDKCNGCGVCVPSCAEGALQIVNGKARLVKDQYCDGLGACLGECPQGALEIIEREAPDFNEKEVKAFLHEKDNDLNHDQRQVNGEHGSGGGCPGSRMMFLKPANRSDVPSDAKEAASELGQWPVQLHLVPANAPYFKEANLLVAADCVPFAYADFHHKFLKGKAVVIGCPKLDDRHIYLEKLTDIIRFNHLSGITVVHMEVPCCFGMLSLVKEAVNQAGVNVPVYEATVGINGEIKNQA